MKKRTKTLHGRTVNESRKRGGGSSRANGSYRRMSAFSQVRHHKDLFMVSSSRLGGRARGLGSKGAPPFPWRCMGFSAAVTVAAILSGAAGQEWVGGEAGGVEERVLMGFIYAGAAWVPLAQGLHQLTARQGRAAFTGSGLAVFVMATVSFAVAAVAAGLPVLSLAGWPMPAEGFSGWWCVAAVAGLGLGIPVWWFTAHKVHRWVSRR